MLKFLTRFFTPSMGVALLALVVSLGGVSYAAVSLARNSVGSAQVKNHSLTSVDLKAEVTTVQRPLGSHQTMQGTFVAAGADGASGYIGASITFPQRLPNNFNKNHLQYRTGTTSAKCPGAGQAAPGWACFYEGQSNSIDEPPCCIYDEDYNNFAVGTFGVRMYWVPNGTDNYVDGLWAITAP